MVHRADFLLLPLWVVCSILFKYYCSGSVVSEGVCMDWVDGAREEIPPPMVEITAGLAEVTPPAMEITQAPVDQPQP